MVLPIIVLLSWRFSPRIVRVACVEMAIGEFHGENSQKVGQLPDGAGPKDFESYSDSENSERKKNSPVAAYSAKWINHFITKATTRITPTMKPRIRSSTSISSMNASFLLRRSVIHHGRIVRGNFFVSQKVISILS